MRLVSELAWTAAPPRRTAAPPDHPDFARLVGPAGWARLPAPLRARFARAPAVGETIRYEGVMREVACSRGGWLLARLCRLIGLPLAPHAGRDVPAGIALQRSADGHGIVWARRYAWRDHPASVVLSTKRLDRDGALLECAGGGIAMRLAVFERDGALHFVSRAYLWRLGPWRVRLPDLLTPGVTHVVHENRGDARFRFTMTIRHPWLGLLFAQDGLFDLADAGASR